jgi:predicted ATP-grasp superfamily ATP-dependent carboligase
MTNKFAGNVPKYVYLDKYFISNNSFEINNNLYPQKWLNMEHKRIITIISDYFPYGFIIKREDGQGIAKTINSTHSFNVDIDGTDGLLAREFIKKYNFSVILSSGQSWSKAFEMVKQHFKKLSVLFGSETPVNNLKNQG